jgi:hypothetical protein
MWWMGHGARMGIAWGNMEDGKMGPKHSSQNMFWGFELPEHWNACWVALPKLDMFLWVVGFEVLVSRVMFRGAQFSTSRSKHRATTEKRHVFVAVYFKGPITYAWKPTSGCLAMSRAFMTCWNNVEGMQREGKDG